MRWARLSPWPPPTISGPGLASRSRCTPRPVSTLWPPNALLLAGLLLTPPRLVGRHPGAPPSAPISRSKSRRRFPIGMVLCWFVSNCAEALLAATLLRRFGDRPPGVRPFQGRRALRPCARSCGAVSLVVPRRLVRQAERLGDQRLLDRLAHPVFLERARHADAGPGHRDGGHERAADSRASARARWIEAGLGLAVLLLTCWLVFVVPRAGCGHVAVADLCRDPAAARRGPPLWPDRRECLEPRLRLYRDFRRRDGTWARSPRARRSTTPSRSSCSSSWRRSR